MCIRDSLWNVSILRPTNLVNRICSTGISSEDLLKTIRVPLPKNCNAKESKDYRIINIMCRVTKAVIRLMLRRTERKIEDNTGEDQFGFRNVKGTRHAT